MENYTFTGIIGNDAKAVETKTGFAINFDVAINKTYYNKELNEYVKQVKWVHCTKWAKSDSVATFIKKGMLVLVEGDPHAKNYVNSDGEIKDSFCVTVQKIEFFDKKETISGLDKEDSETED